MSGAKPSVAFLKTGGSLIGALVFALSMGACGDGGGSSGNANTPPAAPGNVTVTVSSTGTWIMWDLVSERTTGGDRIKGAMGEPPADTSEITYNVYHAAAPGVTKDNWSSLAEGVRMTNVTTPHFCTQLNAGTMYYAVVTAVNEYGESAESEEVSMTPQVDS